MSEKSLTSSLTDNRSF